MHVSARPEASDLPGAVVTHGSEPPEVGVRKQSAGAECTLTGEPSLQPTSWLIC